MELLTFKLSVGRFAIPVKEIDEFLPMMSVRYLPDSPRFIYGAINLRGELLPVIDLLEKLGGQRSACSDSNQDNETLSPFRTDTRLLVANQQTHRYAVIVDGVERIENFESEDFRSNVSSDSKYFQSVLMTEGEMTPVIHLNALLTTEQLSHLNSSQLDPTTHTQAENTIDLVAPKKESTDSVQARH